MTLHIKTFSNQSGGNAFYKAVTHPLVATKARDLVSALRQGGPAAIYDPLGQLESFIEFFPLDGVQIAGFFVQDVEQVGKSWNGLTAKPITELKECTAKSLLIAAFDSLRLGEHIKPYTPKEISTYSFDSLRLPDPMLSDRRRYLSNINFATNLAFFRDSDKHHTRIVTANYWSAYGSASPKMWCYLMGGDGKKIAEWFEDLPAANAIILLDSKEIRKRFQLQDFTGQLFMHVVGAAGHEIIKYALDTYGDEAHMLSCTHDANAWPSNQYAGLPAPGPDENVVLWVQNSHPRQIPAGEIGLNLMGSDKIVYLNKDILPYATYKLDVAELLPDAKWPQQIEIQANKNFVRPRYEITSKGNHMRMAHPNVERDDLEADPKLAKLTPSFGKGHILPAPILPLERYASMALPTPMSTNLKHLPVKALIYDATGELVGEHSFGNLKRNESVALSVDEIVKKSKLPSGYGHIEIIYDFAAGAEADGWLHALFRYQDRRSGHGAETSFGSHIFNAVMTYKNEPQSYAGRAPGLSTRLFLRMGPKPYETICHLIYPASKAWHAKSETSFVLTSMSGQEIATRTFNIPCSGSLFWQVSDVFTEEQINSAGQHPYVLIRDTTCRLFGYHGLMSGDKAFSFDHMFGF